MDLYMYGCEGINRFAIIAIFPDEGIDWDRLLLMTPYYIYIILYSYYYYH